MGRVLSYAHRAQAARYIKFWVLLSISQYEIIIKKIDAKSQKRRCVMPRFSPARSLRGRPASLRTFPEGVWSRLPKRLILLALLAIGRAILGTQSIFLPALREKRVRLGAACGAGFSVRRRGRARRAGCAQSRSA